MDQQPHLAPRIGSFLILVGIGVMLVFLGSYMAKVPHYNYLYAGLIILTLGILLRHRTRSHQPSGRFRVVRGIYERRKEKQEQKKEKK